MAAPRVAGENTVTIRWEPGPGLAEETLSLFTLDYTVSALSASFDKVINTYNDWNITNPNPFSVNYTWTIPETGSSSSKAVGPGITSLRIPAPSVNPYTIVLTWDDENGVSRERAFPSVPGYTPTGTNLTIEVVESTLSTNFLNWTVTNPSQEPISYAVTATGYPAERRLTAQPGENRVAAPRVAGENTVTIRWEPAPGFAERTISLFTLDYTVSALSASFDRVINTYNDWNIVNPNPFTVSYTWTIPETGSSSSKVVGPGITNLRIPAPSVNSYTMVLTWNDENGVSQQRTFTAQQR